ncbi:MAG TPA: hypothetical protein PLY25_09820 [Bacteroidia bacterium]|nr:hypothetical protein [Bacteroidia bacterium]
MITQPFTMQQTILFNSIMAGLEATQIMLKAKNELNILGYLTEDIEVAVTGKEYIEEFFGGDYSHAFDNI